LADRRIRKPASRIGVTRNCSRRQHDTAGREIAGRHREYLGAAYHRATEVPPRTRSAYRPGAQFAIVTPIEKTCCHSALTRERIGRGRGANCRIVHCVRHRCMFVARDAPATNRPSLRPATLCSRVDRGRRPAVDVPSARSRRASSRLEAAADRADREARSSLHVSACGTDSDEFEHWISETIEQPAADAIDRVRSSGRLKPEDWCRLASLNSAPQR